MTATRSWVGQSESKLEKIETPKRMSLSIEVTQILRDKKEKMKNTAVIKETIGIIVHKEIINKQNKEEDRDLEIKEGKEV